MSMIGQRVGNYRIVRQIGQGGMGTVYEAVHTSIHQRAAVKVLAAEFCQDRDALRRFFTEARILSTLDHPSIVKVFDFGKLEGGVVYMMMEYLSGQTLYQRLEQMVGCLPMEEALGKARQIAQALQAAHDKGVLHRDVKPGNIFVVTDPENPEKERIKLLDFGLAKLQSASTFSDDPMSRTAVGMVIGTPYYMSPEQIRCEPVNEKTDVYALGVLLYRMLTGKLPFEGRTDPEIFQAHLSKQPVPVRSHVPSLPERLSSLVQGMLAKDPALRPSVALINKALAETEAEAGADATIFGDMLQPSIEISFRDQIVPTLPPPPAPPPSRWRWWAISTVSAAALLSAAVGLFLRFQMPR